MGGVDDLPFPRDQSFLDTLFYDTLEDLAELILSQPGSPEVGDGGVVWHFGVYSQVQEVFIGQVDAGVFDHLAVGIAVEVLEETEAEHELGVFGGSAEVRSISVFDQGINEGEINGLVYLAEKVVLGDDLIVEVAAVEGFLGRARTEHIGLLGYDLRVF